MSMTLAEIEAEALKLDPEEREQLANTLFFSLDDRVEIDEEWRVEIARRIEEVQTGTVQTIPVEQVFAEIDAERIALVDETEEFDPEALAEAQRRYEELRSGAVQGESLEEVINHLRSPLHR